MCKLPSFSRQQFGLFKHPQGWFYISSIPAPADVTPRPSQELEASIDVMDLNAGVAVLPSQDGIGLHNLEISIQNNGPSQRTVSTPRTNGYIPRVTPLRNGLPYFSQTSHRSSQTSTDGSDGEGPLTAHEG